MNKLYRTAFLSLSTITVISMTIVAGAAETNDYKGRSNYLPKEQNNHGQKIKRRKVGNAAQQDRKHKGIKKHHNRNRHYNRHERHHRDYNAGDAIIGIIGGILINDAFRSDRRSDFERCDERYRSFRWNDGTFQPYYGSRKLCPYLR